MPDTLVAATQAKEAVAVLPRVVPPNGPPLDFSFQDLSDLAELPSHEVNDAPNIATVPAGEPSGLRLSYNALKTVDSLPALLVSTAPPLSLFPASPLHSLPLSSLHWLDLSNNHLPSVPAHLHSLPHLSTLYLHSNAIASLASLSSLLPLPYLCKLTLHGNPVTQPPRGKARVVEVRLRVLGLLAKKEGARLKQLDFVGVTEGEVLAGLRLIGGKARRIERRVNKAHVEAEEE